MEITVDVSETPIRITAHLQEMQEAVQQGINASRFTLRRNLQANITSHGQRGDRPAYPEVRESSLRRRESWPAANQRYYIRTHIPLIDTRRGIESIDFTAAAVSATEITATIIAEPYMLAHNTGYDRVPRREWAYFTAADRETLIRFIREAITRGRR